MKQFLLPILISLIFYSQPLQAINLASKGVCGGLAASAFRSDYISNQNLQFNYSFGIFATTTLNPQLDLRMELQFSRKGAVLSKSNIDDNGKDSAVENASYLYYLELPVLAGLRLNQNYSVYAGPYASLFLDGWDERRQTLQLEGRETEIITRTEIQPTDLNSVDFGIIVGAALQYSWWRVEARYVAGLRKIYPDTDYRHMQLQALFSIFF